VCTGGLAAPKLGACGDGYKLLERLGHTIVPCFPAIAALITPPEPVRGLKGIRAEAEIALLCGDEAVRSERGEVLFADSGVSGIAAMQLARTVNAALLAGKRCAVRLDFVPGLDAPALLRKRAADLPKRGLGDFLNGIVPRRLGQTLVKAAGLPLDVAAGELSERQIDALAGALSGWTLPVTGTQGYDQAQVTGGGASLKDFDIRCMGSLRRDGLFAAGEVLDVDGDCGGFNLQWAWSSALLAAEGIEAVLDQG
jgi:predicted Rossmann fold flavoprotein